MRYLFLIGAVLAATQFVPAAYARSDEGMMAGAYNAGPGGEPQYQAGPNDPRNCGTPDDFKPCGRMPRHPMMHYPAGGR